MTLPPTQNQYPGWQPPTQDGQQNGSSLNPSTPQPLQDIQSAQTPQPITGSTSNNFAFEPQSQAPQPQSQAQALQPDSQAETGDLKPKKPFKGPLILLAAMIIILGGITSVVLLTSDKSPSDKKLESGNGTARDQAPQAKNEPKSSAEPAKSEPAGDQADASNQPYEFINNQQIANLKNLQTSLTTYQSQNAKKELPAATPQGWALLKANNVIDPVTNKPYTFATSGNSHVGEVQYMAQSVCSSDNSIIASTDQGSFALRTKLYSGVYYCVDSSNS